MEHTYLTKKKNAKTVVLTHAKSGDETEFVLQRGRWHLKIQGKTYASGPGYEEIMRRFTYNPHATFQPLEEDAK